MAEDVKQRRRAPSVERAIAEISADKDLRVRIIGTVIDHTDNEVLIDDGTGKAEIQFASASVLAGAERGKLVRVIARVLPLIDGFALRGEAVQNLHDFDMQLFKRWGSIMEK